MPRAFFSAAAIVDAIVDAQEGRFAMDEPAFQAFYARTAGPLSGYLRRLTGNYAVAEDLLQDAYLRFLGAARVPDGEEHQKNYLFRIATNLARDHFRRAGRQPRLAVAAEPAVEPAPVQGDVWALLARVSPRDRELLLLAYVEGLTHREIAGVTGLMRASVKPLLFRARRRFAALLRDAGLAGDGHGETS
jgi:RNA polymerase sigma-70 factor, ECF subfamily